MWNSGGLRAAPPSTAQKMEFFDKGFLRQISLSQPFWKHITKMRMISDLINEYRTHHHCIHAPTPLDNKHSGIILLVNKQYDVLHTEIKMPSRMVNIHLAHTVTKHAYNLTVYYAV